MPGSVLIEARLDFARAEAELEDFKHWLDGHEAFSERQVVAELKTRTNLCLLIQIAAGKGQPDR